MAKKIAPDGEAHGIPCWRREAMRGAVLVAAFLNTLVVGALPAANHATKGRILLHTNNAFGYDRWFERANTNP